MTSLKLISVVAPKIKHQHWINHLLCTNLCVPNAVLIMLRKLREHYYPWNDKDSVVNIHLNECTDVQHIFNFTKLTPSLFSDTIVDDLQDLRTSHINLVEMSTRIIDRHKNWNIFLFKGAIKIKEKKLILNWTLV